MWSDPIVDEVRRVREAYAAQFNFDLDEIYQDLKRREAERSVKLSGEQLGRDEKSATTASNER
jgi:hypothetical protein